MQEIELYDRNVSLELLGASGTNRKFDDNDAAATNDAEAIRSWLSHHSRSAETLRKYTREARRLVIWSVGFQRKPISSLKLSDMQEYREFLRNPPEALVGARSRIGGREWKPFVGERTEKSVGHAMVILMGMFTYLQEIGYIKRSPMIQLRNRLYDEVEGDEENFRYLDAEQIAAIKTVLDRDDEPFVHRTRFAIALMLMIGMRIHEVTSATMGGFKVRSDGTCWLRFLRKGRKWYTAPVPYAMVLELKRYRLLNGLEAMPVPGEQTPMLLTFKGQSDGLGDRELRNDFYEVCARASELIADEDKRATLLEASPHWLRHAFAKRALRRATNKEQAHQVQRLMSHRSLETTLLYDDTPDKEQHDFVKDTDWE